ncbi:integral membrane protein [Halodesulfurarchaeum formicicum]|uniref:Integral membrane protein n=1 Tax=Halodesulfurarchaeum formicicum TaxID=1873524 RepID=A0A1D8S3E8_9EURY|nr:TspO/MBR family protein [Halodesulfurarchaeum formicicum]AOW79879.1 integral membrane protein [Halodesulfurarchaeum formicicum]APE95172.1 integral membrane protein [Halodesulfurarchaeum formicicum]
MQTDSGLAGFARNRPGLALGLAILAVELVGASGAIFTAQGLGEWYSSLVRPAIAPPNWVFGPVWTALFALMGVAVWLVWRQAPTDPDGAKLAIGVFVVHFLFNLGWSAVFFGQQALGAGLLVILALWMLIVTTILVFDRVDRRAALLLVPYLLWVSFATYLNYQFWVLN